MFSLLGSEKVAPPKELKLSFTIDGKDRVSTLTRTKGAYNEGVKATLGSTGEKVDIDEHFAYYSEDRNWVLTFTNDNHFEGLVFEEDNSKIHHIIVKDGEMKVDGKVRDYFPGPMRNLLSEVSQVNYWDNCHAGQSRGLSSLDMGMAVGNVFHKIEGSKTGALLNQFVTLANTIYERQMDIVLKIDDVFVADTPEAFAPSSCTLDMSTQLYRFRDWRSRPSKQPLWHLIDDCFGAFGNTLGIAFLSTACGTSSNVGVTQYFSDQYSSTQYQTWATFAHEAGHNFAAQHSFEEGQQNTGGIMDYGTIKSKEINGVSQFNTKYRKAEVCNKFNSAANSGCLNLGVAARNEDFTNVGGEIIEGSVDRDLTCFKHSNRVAGGNSNLLKTVFSSTRLGCKRECETTEECGGFVLSDEGYCQLIGGTNSDDLLFSSDFDAYLCAEGKLRESLTKESIDDLLEKFDGARLKEECCVEEDNQTYLGMNYFYRETLTQNSCERRCVRDTKCEVSSYDKETNGCYFFGGETFTNERIFSTDFKSMTCDRVCLSTQALASETAPTVVESSSGNIAAAFFGVAAVVAFVGAAVVYKRRKSVAPPPSEASAEEAEIKHNNL